MLTGQPSQNEGSFMGAGFAEKPSQNVKQRESTKLERAPCEKDYNIKTSLLVHLENIFRILKTQYVPFHLLKEQTFQVRTSQEWVHQPLQG